MKYYKRQIKPYIKPPQLQGFNGRPYPVEGYDWVSEDLEEELRNSIVVSDPWSRLIFEYKIVEVTDATEIKHGHWIDHYTNIVCSVCGAEYSDEIVFMNRNFEYENPCYCPNCGAYMKGEKNDK